MPRNGSGVYNLPSGNPVLPSSLIRSDWANTTLADIAQALSGSIAKDGQTAPTSNLIMAGYHHTNVGNATAMTDYAAAGQVQSLAMFRLTTVGSSSTAYTANMPLGATTPLEGVTYIFIPNATNTTNTPTLNVGGSGALNMVDGSRVNLAIGALVSGKLYSVRLSGSAWITQSMEYGPLMTTGGSMLGPVVLPADPTAPLMAATKQYVDAATGTGGPPSAITKLDSSVTVTDTGTNGTVTTVIDGVTKGIFNATYNFSNNPHVSALAAPDMTKVPNVRMYGYTTAIGGGSPANSGTVDNNVVTRFGAGSVVRDEGLTTAGHYWTQTRAAADFSTQFPYLINPNGGMMGVNTGTALPAWSGQLGVHVGPSGSLTTTSSAAALNLAFNAYYDGAVWRNMAASVSSWWVSLTTTNLTIFYATAGSVGASLATTSLFEFRPTGILYAGVGGVLARRVHEQQGAVAASGAVTCDWGLGGTSMAASGAATVSFSNIPAAGAGDISTHAVFISSNFNNVTWPGSVNWGAGGKPSIAGAANVMLSTIDGGVTVFGSVVWRAV